MTRRRCAAEDGFTLVELLVSIAITGILIAGLGTMFLATRTAEDTASERFSVNNDLATASSYFQSDVHSHTSFAENAAASCGGGTARLQLSWTDMATGDDFQVNYVESADRVDRRVCADDGGGWAQRSSNLFLRDASITQVLPLITGLRLELAAADETLAVVAYTRTGL